MFKWTQFMIKARKGNKVLLYNFMNGSIVLLSVAEWKSVSNFIVGKEKECPNLTNLVKEGFLIKDSYDEKKSFLKDLDKELKNNKHFTLHILPTTGCNFACPYCYQSGIERQYFLNEDILSKSLKYIDNYLKDRGIKYATLVIHGGEPTVFWTPVITLLPKMKEIFEKYGIEYRTQIVSNGYNLTEEKADLLSQYNWQRFQVTIDGPPETHNKRRILANGGETFDKIIKNIHYVLDNDKIERVSIRINFDKGNVEAIPSFLEYLSKEFDKKKIILSLGFISKTVENTGANDYISQYGINLDEITASYLKLYKKAVKLGFEMPDIFMFDGMCTAKLDNSMVVSSDGSIFKCLSGVGREEFVVGNVASEQYDLPNYLFPSMYEACLNEKCEFLPLCNTGCRFNAYLKNGSLESRDCRREILEKMNIAILKYRYL